MSAVDEPSRVLAIVLWSGGGICLGLLVGSIIRRLCQKVRALRERLRTQHVLKGYWMGRVVELEGERDRYKQGLETIRDYTPTPEVMYDDFAYDRMVASFKGCALAALNQPESA